MAKTKYTHNAETTIFHAMIPTEPEPSVTYAFVAEDGQNQAVTMPKLFIDLADDFERWYKEERHVLLRDFHHEYMEELKNRGNYYAKLVYDNFLRAWSNEPYYKRLVEIWEQRNEGHVEKMEKAIDDKNYQQANYHQEKISENKHLILKAKAALYFINQTKAFVKSDFGIPDIVPPTILNTPAPTSTDGKQEKKAGRTKDPDIQKRNLDIFNDYRKYVEADKLNKADALDRVYKSYKKRFSGEPKNIKDQIRRIIKATQSDIN